MSFNEVAAERGAGGLCAPEEGSCLPQPAAPEEALSLPSTRLAGRKEVRAAPAAPSSTASLKPAHRIKRKAAPRAAATSRLMELGTQG